MKLQWKKWVAAAGMSLMAVSAHAALVFDNFKGTGADAYNEETRGSSYTFGTVINVLADTTINQIGVRWRPNNDMNVKFAIWDSELGGTVGSLNWATIGNNLLFSQTKFFAGNPNGALDYIYSDVFADFILQAGHRYDLGIIFDTGTALGSWDIQNGCGNVNTAQNNIESINSNANIVNFAAPNSNAGYACVDPHIQLISGGQQTVSEPGSLALLSLSLMGVYGVSRRVRRVKA